MLQVWKIERQVTSGEVGPSMGWAAAFSAKEAVELSGFPDTVATPDPERLWIARERVIWVR